jgi:hypothetical protein
LKSAAVALAKTREMIRLRLAQPNQKTFNETFNDFFNNRGCGGYVAG